MIQFQALAGPRIVALRKESVDRNRIICGIREHIRVSLSARRAWIEISMESSGTCRIAGRSPQGERG